MAFTTLMPQVNTPTVGAASLFSTSDSNRNLQFNPQPGVGFSGTVVLEGSSAGSPGASDWVELSQLLFSAHSQNVSLNFYTDLPWMRVKVTAVSAGGISAYASE